MSLTFAPTESEASMTHYEKEWQLGRINSIHGIYNTDNGKAFKDQNVNQKH
jgi:hypothetical protein